MQSYVFFKKEINLYVITFATGMVNMWLLPFQNIPDRLLSFKHQNNAPLTLLRKHILLYVVFVSWMKFEHIIINRVVSDQQLH